MPGVPGRAPSSGGPLPAGLGVDPDDPPGHRPPAVTLPRTAGQVVASERTGEDFREGVGQRFLVARRDEEAVAPGREDLGEGRDCGADDGSSAGEALEHGDGVALGVARKHKDVGGVEDVGHPVVVLPAAEIDPRPQGLPLAPELERSGQGTGSGHDEPDVPHLRPHREPREGPFEFEKPFRRDERSGVEDEASVDGPAESPPGTLAGRGTETFLVDPVRDDADLSAEPGKRLEPIGQVTGDGNHACGAPTGLDRTAAVAGLVELAVDVPAVSGHDDGDPARTGGADRRHGGRPEPMGVDEIVWLTVELVVEKAGETSDPGTAQAGEIEIPGAVHGRIVRPRRPGPLPVAAGAGLEPASGNERPERARKEHRDPAALSGERARLLLEENRPSRMLRGRVGLGEDEDPQAQTVGPPVRPPASFAAVRR